MIRRGDKGLPICKLAQVLESSDHPDGIVPPLVVVEAPLELQLVAQAARTLARHRNLELPNSRSIVSYLSSLCFRREGKGGEGRGGEGRATYQSLRNQ